MEQTPIRTPEIRTHYIPSVEQHPTPETTADRPAAPAEQSSSEFTAPTLPTVPASTVVPVLPAVSNIHQAIENILSDGLQLEYEQLDPAMQEKFRTTGESTATQIEELLSSTKVQIQKIIGLIMEWLKILPGVNSFFLQQEAKIKADTILKLKE